MDEYLFLTMAKLKADQRKLEHEQRERTAVSAEPTTWVNPEAADPKYRRYEFLSNLKLREQS